MREGRRIQVQGTVQGVGFRPFVYRLARKAGLGGRVRNDAQGVTIEAYGPEDELATFLARLSREAPPAAVVRDVRTQAIPPEPTLQFAIEGSVAVAGRRVSIPPDLATCAACRTEVADPQDRRYRYAFTNCTDCGPRFTIAQDVPYDRAATSMAGFRMCGRCAREYADPEDRRFHAQPNACPDCGPRLRLVTSGGDELPGDPVLLAAAALVEGRIVSVKGLGGFHLACDATSPEAVRQLRERKKRDQKPFAVMVRDLEEGAALAEIGPEEARLLRSIERPIVLVSRRGASRLAPEVAPDNPLVGLMLAYTPLHDLLLAAAGRPLVMTSGNRSDEPMATEDAEARERLSGIADLFLLHDRAIENRCDDSVARIVAGRPVILRRARGYVPRPVPVGVPFSRPVLACGAHLKNAFCLGVGSQAWLGPHVGDLESLAACRSFEESVERLQRFLGVTPEVIAHDLHPDYFSTAYALARPEAIKIGVQHHHAHVVSAMAEHGLRGPVLGVAYDGTGYGSDGTAWGGEILLARPEAFERLATFRPVLLPGSDQAIRDVWRIALAVLHDAFDGDPPVDDLALFRRVPAGDVSVVKQLIERRVQAPPAHGAGRYFDALGALVLGRPRADHEGQVALAFNLAADRTETGTYPFVLEEGSPVRLDLRPLVREVVSDLLHGRDAGVISGRFHNALADATAALVRRAAQETGRLPVVLTGGCFQNALLAEGVARRLTPAFDVRLHGEVPPGDGGLALGQAVVADARLRAAEGPCA